MNPSSKEKKKKQNMQLKENKHKLTVWNYQNLETRNPPASCNPWLQIFGQELQPPKSNICKNKMGYLYSYSKHQNKNNQNWEKKNQ